MDLADAHPRPRLGKERAQGEIGMQGDRRVLVGEPGDRLRVVVGLDRALRFEDDLLEPSTLVEALAAGDGDADGGKLVRDGGHGQEIGQLGRRRVPRSPIGGARWPVSYSRRDEPGRLRPGAE